MATYTPNLNFRKPLTGEKYDVVADLNDMKDKVDKAFGEISFNVKNFGVKGDGVTDDTVAIQNIINLAHINRQIVFFPQGDYLVTDTLSIYSGTQLLGISKFQYNNGFGIDPKASAIKFMPTSLKDLFYVVDSFNQGGFNFHMSVDGLTLQGNGFARYALNLNGVIYSLFQNISATGFEATLYNYSTINNRFVNIYTTGRTACIIYAGNNETTDTWNQCSFQQSPKGIIANGTTIGIRFIDCVFEQLDTYGVEIPRETQNMTFDDCYAEDVPFTTGEGNAMFKIGYGGTVMSLANNITVIGGTYNGRNAGNSGSFFDSDYLDGAEIIAPVINRYTNVFKVSTNTKDHAITVHGCRGIGRTNFINGSLAKIKGDYHAANNNETPRIDSNLGIVRMMNLYLKDDNGVEYNVKVNTSGQITATPI